MASIPESTDPFLRSFEWRTVRMRALEAQGGKCQACGRTARDGVVINVDHIKPRRHYPELALTLSNLQVLCAPCNHGKGNWSERDWRPTQTNDVGLIRNDGLIRIETSEGQHSGEGRGDATQHLVLERLQGHDGLLLCCPFCGFNYVHPMEPEVLHGNDNYEAGYGVRGDVVRLPCQAECGHCFALVLAHHKGWTTVLIEPLPPQELA